MSPPTARTSVSRPAFRSVNGRRLFELEIVPTGPVRGEVLYLPPYAEEMNRCRCHVVEAARRLAAQGQRCLLLDHHGTGESEGLSTEADWSHWLADASATAQALAARDGLPLTLWGLRTGALLAAEVAAGAGLAIERLLLWQPVLDGKQFVNQYLRLRIASQMVHGAQRETTAEILDRLAAGEDVEVAGYPLSHRLVQGLSTRRLADLKGLAGTRIDWIEIAAQADQPLPPGSRRVADGLLAAGARLHSRTVVAPQIWQLAGVHEAPALIEATVQCLGAVA